MFRRESTVKQLEKKNQPLKNKIDGPTKKKTVSRKKIVSNGITNQLLASRKKLHMARKAERARKAENI
jgi:hypothetical protein